MDADFSHDPEELKEKIEFFKKNELDMLIASRYIDNSKIINWPLSRRILSKFANKLARMLLGVPVSDYTNGFRFYSKKAVKLILSKFYNTKIHGPLENVEKLVKKSLNIDNLSEYCHLNFHH